MGIFTRLRDIINSNLNAMLDKAEDPEKLVKMMIREMEDTLVEIKMSCAGSMATKKKIERELDMVRERAAEWESRAELAIEKGREDLAREALLEKRRFLERERALTSEIAEVDEVIAQYQQDILQLEEKLKTAREKQRILIQRHEHSRQKKRAENAIRKVQNSDVLQRFAAFEHHIDRMEAEADLVNFGRKPSLEEEFQKLSGDQELERELEALKQRKRVSPSPEHTGNDTDS